uniref:Putative secreted protein n=1 Tax=Anopheles darlingi TaxID=43151 RepID=A0A2M4DJQ3_ANODA
MTQAAGSMLVAFLQLICFTRCPPIRLWPRQSSASVFDRCLDSVFTTTILSTRLEVKYRNSSSSHPEVSPRPPSATRKVHFHRPHFDGSKLRGISGWPNSAPSHPPKALFM